MTTDWEPEPRRRLPFGIVVIAVLRILDAASVAAIALGWRSIEMSGLPPEITESQAITVIGLTWASVAVVGAVGLLLLRRWGWVISMLMVGVGLVVLLVREFSGAPDHLELLLLVVTAFYLNQRSVRALAERHVGDRSVAADALPG